MDALQEAKSKRAKAVADAQALAFEQDGTTPRAMTDDDRVAFDALLEDEKGLTEAIDAALVELDAQRLVRINDATARMRVPEKRIAAPMATTASPLAEKRVIPANARRTGSLRAFKGPEAELAAYRFGTFFAAVAGVPWAIQRARDQGLPIVRAASEGTNTAGGFLVPDEFEATLIDIRESYGVLRQYAKVIPMSSDTKRIPRRTGGLTAYFVGESEAGTESQKTYDQVGLIAKKLIALSQYSNELGEDAIINIGDDLADEIAYAFAYKEDLCGFLGTGAQTTYGSITGLGPSMTNLNGVDEGGGVIVGTGDTPAELVLADFDKVVAILPAYADNLNTAWYCHKTVHGHMRRLEDAAGGNSIRDIVEGDRRRMFLGYPVVFVQVMQTGTAVSQPLAHFGDLRMAMCLGSRRGLTIAVSDSALNSFEKDELTVRGTERFDINVHDIGTATAAGPIVTLLGKAS